MLIRSADARTRAGEANTGPEAGTPGAPTFGVSEEVR